MIVHWSPAQKRELWEMHEEHPGWSSKRLANEMALPWKAVENMLYRLKAMHEEHWLDGARVGFFDIESTDLKANVGYMLCWGLLTTDGRIYSDRIKRTEILGPAIEPDKRIVASALRALREVDVIVTYNGIHFDVPFLRTRSLAHGLRFPAYGQLLHIDLYFAVKSLVRTTNKRMGTITEFLGMTPKDHYDVRVWNSARRGDERSLQHIYDHNISDLHITQDLMIALGPYKKWIRRSI